MQRRLFSTSIFLALLIPGLALARAAHADAPSIGDRVRAAFIFNFIQFTEWPGGTFGNPNDPIVLGVLGDSPVTSVLKAIVVGKTVNGRALEIREFSSIDECAQCNVLFISGRFSRDLSPLLQEAAARSILTISSLDDFADHGGIIQFYIDDGKERFEINTLAAERARLQLSSKLLKLAKIVRK